MGGMHALHKILANCARPRQASVMPGEFVEVEPDIFGVILGVNGSDAKRLVADLEELGIDELPLKDRIVAVADHASPAPTVAMAQAQKLWRDFFRAKIAMHILFIHQAFPAQFGRVALELTKRYGWQCNKES